MKTTLIFLLLLFQLSCDNHKKEEHNINSYELIDLYNSQHENCSIYIMEFNEGKYLFRYALSGACKNLTQETYIKKYQLYISQKVKSKNLPNGQFIFDFYPVINNNDSLSYKLKETTELLLRKKKYVKILEKSKERVVLKISNK